MLRLVEIKLNWYSKLYDEIKIIEKITSFKKIGS